MALFNPSVLYHCFSRNATSHSRVLHITDHFLILGTFHAHPLLPSSEAFESTTLRRAKRNLNYIYYGFRTLV